MAEVVWSHDVQKDKKIPAPIVKAWLQSNGVTDGRTQRFEVLDDGTLRWWQLDEAGLTRCECCKWSPEVDGVPYVDRWLRNHLEGPFTKPITVPLLPMMEPYGCAA
jgi:hypothetical protein